MKKLIFLLSLFIAFQATAQEGIQFDHSSWKEAKAKAIEAKKLIFIDFYTQWCGPCLNMAQGVFTLGSVGNFYNDHFVNLKIDAENGEGVMLAKQYGIQSYPTFVFIDPQTEEAVHTSGSNQDKETFLFTGASALEPTKRSGYLAEQKKRGNETPIFLLDYAHYVASRYNRSETLACLEKLITMPGYSLENPQVWTLFEKYISGRENSLFKILLGDTQKYAATHTQKAVEAKLFKEYNYCPDAAEIAAAPEFNGKDFLIAKNEADRLINEAKYEQAAVILDRWMQNPGDFKEDLCNYFRFMTRAATREAFPRFWQDKCLEYSKYMAYNTFERDDAVSHFDYANQLEHYLRTLPEIQPYLPKCLTTEPAGGAKEYSLRPAVLKQKPRKK
ncbi:MAG: thioredoxin family protein [Odoribacter sp.]